MDSKDLKKVEASIKKVYSQQYQEVQDKFHHWYWKMFKEKKKIDEKLAKGELSAVEHLQKMTEIDKLIFDVSDKKNNILDQITEKITNANKIAADHINGSLPKFYGQGMNDAGQDVNDVLSAYSFTLVDQKTITLIADAQPKLLPTLKIKVPKDMEWNKKKLAAEITQGILQGESIGEISKRLKSVFLMNQNSSLRNARTMITCAENKGRLAGYKQAEEKGVELQKKWIAARDGRTRDSHIAVDGETVPVSKKFSNGLMFPGDTDWGKPEDVYNCRCTLGTVVVGFKHYEKKDKEGYTPKKEDSPEVQKLIEKKKDLESKVALAQQNVDNFSIETYEGLWIDAVTEDDFYNKCVKTNEYGETSYVLKSNYYEKKYNQSKAAGYDEDAKWFNDKKILLDKFYENGKIYYQETSELAKLQAELTDVNHLIDLATGKVQFTDHDKYSQQNKDAAIWITNNPYKAYELFYGEAGNVWKTLTEDQKRALYHYTGQYTPINNPLRGFDAEGNFKGIGNIDFDTITDRYGSGERGFFKKLIMDMTDALDKTSFKHDVWLQRGCSYDGMDKFLGIDYDLLRYGSEEELKKALLGTTPIEYAFMSCGTAKSTGFDRPIILNVFCPKGTKGFYAEPISQYGEGQYHRGGRHWDGNDTGQKSVSSENETILQRESRFRIVKVERRNGTIYLDLDLIEQTIRTNILK